MKTQACLVLAGLTFVLASCGDDLPPTQNATPAVSPAPKAPEPQPDPPKPPQPPVNPPPAAVSPPADPAAKPALPPPAQDPPKPDAPPPVATLDKAKLEQELAQLREQQLLINQGTDEPKKLEILNKIRDIENKLALLKGAEMGDGFEVRGTPNPDGDRAILDELVKKAPILNPPPK